MTFAMYAERTAFEGPLTTGVAYAVRVTHDEREQFERQQGWSIKKMYSSNSKNRSQEPAEELGKKFPSEISEIFGTPDLPVEIGKILALITTIWQIKHRGKFKPKLVKVGPFVTQNYSSNYFLQFTRFST